MRATLRVDDNLEVGLIKHLNQIDVDDIGVMSPRSFQPQDKTLSAEIEMDQTKSKLYRKNQKSEHAN